MEKKALLVIILIGVAIRACLIFSAVDGFYYNTDSWKYDRLAYNLAYHRVYALNETGGRLPPYIRRSIPSWWL